jgi:hypothetical protein
VLGVAGNEGWKAYQAQQRDTASERLTTAEMLVANDPLAAMETFGELSESAPGGFALVARLRAAAMLANDGDHAAARRIYAQVQADAANPIYRDLGTLLEVQSLLSDRALQTDTTLDEAQAKLAPLLTTAGPWWHSARELDAVIAMRSGDLEKAQEIFAALKDSINTPAGIRTRATAMHAQIDNAL